MMQILIILSPNGSMVYLYTDLAILTNHSNFKDVLSASRANIHHYVKPYLIHASHMICALIFTVDMQFNSAFQRLDQNQCHRL